MTMYQLRIIESKTGKVEKEFSPCAERRAEKIRNGVEINLDHERYHTEIVVRGDA